MDLNPWLSSEELSSEIEHWFSGLGAHERLKWDIPFGQGPVREVEEQLAQLYGKAHALLFNCGTNALLTLALASDSEGKSILTVPNSPWTTTPFLLAGADLVHAELSPDGVVDRDSLSSRIESDPVDAVLVADTDSTLHDTRGVREICQAHGIPYWADAAQSFGRRLNDGLLASSLADAVVLSFGPGGGKHWVGEAGALLIDDPELYRAAVRISQHPHRYGQEFSLQDEPAAVGIKATPCPFSVLALRRFLRNYLQG